MPFARTRLMPLLAIAMASLSTPALALDMTPADLATIPANSLSYAYPGKGLTVTSTIALNPFNPGPFEGLYIGKSNFVGSQTFSFMLDQPTTSLIFTFNAMSFLAGSHDEGFQNFAVNAGTPTFALTDASGTTFDGTTLHTTIDNGSGTFTATSTQPFTELSFDYYNVGASEGTIFRTVRTPAVPEPATIAALGLGALAMLRRRRR